jgi:hypothetical protein
MAHSASVIWRLSSPIQQQPSRHLHLDHLPGPGWQGAWRRRARPLHQPVVVFLAYVPGSWLCRSRWHSLALLAAWNGAATGLDGLRVARSRHHEPGCRTGCMARSSTVRASCAAVVGAGVQPTGCLSSGPNGHRMARSNGAGDRWRHADRINHEGVRSLASRARPLL